MVEEPTRPTARIPRQPAGPPSTPAGTPRRARAHPASTLGTLVPGLGAVAVVVAIAVRVLAAAAYDPSTALALVGSAGELTVIVGALLASLPYLALALVLAAATATRRPPVPVDADPAAPVGAPRGLLLAGGALAAILLVFAAPWYFPAIAVVVGPLLARLSTGRRPANPTEEELAAGGWHAAQRRALAQVRKGSQRAAAVGALVVTALFLVRLDVWTPTESLEFTDGAQRVAYVMSVDEQWTTLLTPDRQVLRVRSDTIRTRTICEDDPTAQARTLWELATPRLPDSFHIASPPAYPSCPPG